MIQGLYFVDMPHMKKLAMLPRFRSRIFSPQEIKFLMGKDFSPYIIAEMYCAKIAFKKAMGTAFHGCDLKEVSVMADYSGQYYLSLTGRSKMQFTFKKMKSTVSCSHSNKIAMASVIFYDIK